MKKTASSLSGFTLIELMVVVLIIIIVSGSAIAGYFGFTRRQASADDARNFVTELRKTQSLARNLVYPSGCVGLQSYTVVPSCVGENCRSVDIYANCTSGGDANGRIYVKQGEEVLQNTYFTDQSSIAISFMAVTGNITPTGTYVLYSNNNQDSFYIQLYDNGNIEYIDTSAEPTPTGDYITPNVTIAISISPTPTVTPTATPTLPTEISPTTIILDGGLDITVECPLGQTCISTLDATCISMGGDLFHCFGGNCCIGVAY